MFNVLLTEALYKSLKASFLSVIPESETHYIDRLPQKYGI